MLDTDIIVHFAATVVLLGLAYALLETQRRLRFLRKMLVIRRIARSSGTNHRDLIPTWVEWPGFFLQQYAAAVGVRSQGRPKRRGMPIKIDVADAVQVLMKLPIERIEFLSNPDSVILALSGAPDHDPDWQARLSKALGIAITIK